MKQGKDPVEALLSETVQRAAGQPCPPRLAEALQWAVFPGGARIRPKLCLAVAAACGDARAAVVPAAALELLHSASLVHDDLPCFDNAALRRGRASVHAAFGERLAVLSGDALIVMAFEMLSASLVDHPVIAGRLTAVVARGVSAPFGIAAGQAWECESEIDLAAYHRAKTGALFAAATEAGAVATGIEQSKPWATLGIRLGQAYQVADDILDAAGCEEDIGKPVNQDALLDRPNSVHEFGLNGAAQQLRSLVDDAIGSIPDCPGREILCERIQFEADRMLPAHLADLAA